MVPPDARGRVKQIAPAEHTPARVLEQMVEETANRVVAQRRSAVETGTVRAPKHQLITAINAACGRRFVHDDLAQTDALRCEFSPKPCRHVFDRRILQPGDVVQVGVIELPQKRLHRLSDFRVIVKPSRRRIDVALDGNFESETMAVHPAAFVVRRRFRQGLRSFEAEVFREPDAHA